MKTCKTCGRQVRKTSIALILRDGTLKGARVCAECLTSYGVTIVVKPEVKRCKCGAPATKCHVCVSSKGADVTGVVKALKGRVKALTLTVDPERDPETFAYMKAKIEGMESAIELIEGGRL